MIEKIFCGNKKEIIEEFFNEMMLRKKGKTVNEGFGLSGLILDNQFAFKVNEQDGNSYHLENQINLKLFMNKSTNFIKLRDIKNIVDCLEVKKHLELNGILLSFVMYNNGLLVLISHKLPSLNDFQLDMIKNVLNYINSISLKMDNIEFIYDGIENIVIDKWNKDSLDEIINQIKLEKSKKR